MASQYYLEDDVLRKNMLDTSDLVFRLALGQLNRSCGAVENRTIRRKFWDFCELLSISRLLFCGRRRGWYGKDFLGSGNTDSIEGART